MLERIRLNGGHAELSIGGFKYTPDETGAFEVPGDLAKELIRIHGGEYDPGVERLEERVTLVEDQLSAARNLVELKTKELRESKDAVEAYKKKHAKTVDESKPDPKPQPNQGGGNNQQNNQKR